MTDERKPLISSARRYIDGVGVHQSSSQVKRIFCPCGFTHENSGDAMLLLSLVAALRSRYGPDVEIHLASLNAEADASVYNLPVCPEPLGFTFPGRGVLERHLPTIWPLLMIGCSWAFVGLMAGYLRLERWRPGRGTRCLPSSWRCILAETLAADLVVSVPGGYLMARSNRSWQWLRHFCALAVGTLVDKPVVLAPCSIGPFVPLYRPVARWLLQRVNLIVLREEESLRLVQDLGIDRSKIVVAPDMAFAYPLPARSADSWHRPLAEDGAQPKRSLVGVSVRRHSFPRAEAPRVLWENYLSAVAQAIDWIIENIHAEVVMVPQCTGTGGDDPEVARLVADRCRNRASVHVLYERLSVDDLFALYRSVDLLVGTRMHANLFALCSGVPVVAIAYEPKTRGIMRQLALEEYVLDIESISADDLVGLVQRAWQNREDLAETVRVGVGALRERSLDWLSAIGVEKHG